MITSDVIAVFQWWLVLFLLGVGFAPLTFRLFDKFFDKGYIFSKLLGLLIGGYAIFALSVFHVIQFKTSAMIIVLVIVMIGSFLLLPDKWKTLYVLKKGWFIFIAEELFFLAALYIWAYIHSFAPDIHGLEKYMDYGFINSFLRSDYLPPKDMWFPPYYINYYYFGHMLTAILTKLSGISSSISFNLMLSTIFAFCFVQTFSIGANLYVFSKNKFADSLWHTIFGLHQDQTINVGRFKAVRISLSGLLTALLTTFAGNLHILYAFFTQYKADNPVPLWQLVYNPNGFPNAYWYPNATRFIHNTIHEFPIYSWVVADLHGHVLDIPFVLLAIALGLALLFTYTDKEYSTENDVKQTWKIHPLLLTLFGLLLACMYMTNAWDGAIYLLLIALVLLYIHGQLLPLYKKFLAKDDVEEVTVIRKATAAKKSSLFAAWKIAWGRDYLISLLIVIASFFIFTIPYNMYFKPFVSGIGILCAPDFLTHLGKIGPFLFEADHCQRSPWWQLLTLYGFFYFFVSLFSVWVFRTKKYSAADVFVLILVFISTLLIIIPEFIYVKDIYPAHYRANTMFKLVFQAFIMLSISSGYIIVRSFAGIVDLPWGRKILAVCYVFVTIIFVYLVMTYPFLAIKSYYGDLKTYQGLNGIAYLKQLYPTDYDGIAWLNNNVTGQPVVLEAQGDSYTDYGRVSTNTGLPTVLGWTVHEWLWRGSYNIPAPRIEDVKQMYESTDAGRTKVLLNKYNVSYIFIGSMEYQKYTNLNEEKFVKLGKVVFNKGITKIYKVDR